MNSTLNYMRNNEKERTDFMRENETIKIHTDSNEHNEPYQIQS
jgi:hypothetical protein